MSFIIPTMGVKRQRHHRKQRDMTIAKLQLIRRLLLQLVAMVDAELVERGVTVIDVRSRIEKQNCT